MAKKPKRLKRKIEPVQPKPECITVSSEVRKLFPFIDETAKPIKEEAVHKKRIDLRKKGRKLTPRRLKIVSDTLEGIQQNLNALEKSRKRMVDALLAHYGHERISEISGKLGNTLIKESFVLAIESPEKIIASDKVNEEQRKLISKTVLAVDAAFATAKAAGGDELLKLLLEKIKVNRFTLSVVPPSSRTPNAGEAKMDSETDDA